MVEAAPGGAGGFRVVSGELAAGSGQVTGLEQRCEQVAAVVIETVAQMAGSVGHPRLASALTRASETGASRFLDAGALYAHAAQSLRQSADSFSRAEDAAASGSEAIMREVR